MKPELRTALAEKGRCDLPGVLLAAAECAPLAKTGGLADVVGTLPKSLAALGFDARIITPYHRVIKDKYAAQVTHLTDFYIDLGWRHQYVGIERLLLDGIVIYLVDNEFYFGDRIYLGGEAEGEQYAFFARAILEALPRLDFTPEVLHCNDWHTAVLPMLMKTQYAGRMQSRMQTLLTIHNIAYQGKFSFEFVQDLLGIDARYYTPEFMELNGCANLLKAGCVFADHINTVSPSYVRGSRAFSTHGSISCRASSTASTPPYSTPRTTAASPRPTPWTTCAARRSAAPRCVRSSGSRSANTRPSSPWSRA